MNFNSNPYNQNRFKLSLNSFKLKGMSKVLAKLFFNYDQNISWIVKQIKTSLCEIVCDQLMWKNSNKCISFEKLWVWDMIKKII